MKEIEFKYSANYISLEKFHSFCKKKKPIEYKQIAGYDHFFKNPKDITSFYRHRIGLDMNQLTLKKKLTDDNNFIRIEHNIDLSKESTEEIIADFCKELGYFPTKSIFKNAFIYIYDGHVVVYYICYDKDMNELGRFIEIEIEEVYASKHEKEAWSDLVLLEHIYKPLGISSKYRVTSSLAEMYG